MLNIEWNKIMQLNFKLSIKHTLDYDSRIHVGLRNELKSIALLEFSTTHVKYPF